MQEPLPHRHAYLIMAHNEPEILRVLVGLHDDPRNDIFIMIDKKADFNQFKDIHTEKSELVWSKRIDNRWDSFTNIEAEMMLMETAYNHDQYRYFRLLSGVDLPLKTQDFIHDFFEKNDGKEFVEVRDDEECRKHAWRYRFYHFFMRYYASKRQIVRIVMRRLSDSLANLQNHFGVWRHGDIFFKMGSVF